MPLGMGQDYRFKSPTAKEGGSWIAYRKPVVTALKSVYRAPDAAAGRHRSDRVRGGPLGAQIPGDYGSVAAQLGTGDPVLSVPLEVRRMIYTTNAIDSLNSRNEVDLAAVARGDERLEDAGTRMACGKSPARFGDRFEMNH
jgi:Transposase, Mutator family